MIAPHCFSANWLRKQAAVLRARDVRNFEKCVLALELVSRLSREGLDFVFKGGTSLILHFEPIRRLSIDVDILSSEPFERVTAVLEAATRDRPPFVSWEHQLRRDRESPPTRHFRVNYESAFYPASRTALPSIQIDLITEESPYARLERRPLQTSFLEIEEAVEITMPSAASLLGDKLATFAPSTIGYPYRPIIATTGEPDEPRPIKVVKHLFDVGELSTLVGSLDETLETYRRVHEQQCLYRGGAWTVAETLSDTLDAAFWVSRIDGRPTEENEKIAFFRQGIRALDSHLFDVPFQRAEARLAAGRAALAAHLLREGITRFDLAAFAAAEPDVAALAEASLDGVWSNLNRLMQTDLKAFECWHRAQSLT